MLKDVLKGLCSIILIVIYIPTSFFMVKKNWIPTAKELNQVGYKLPTTYWSSWWHNTKENLWEISIFD